MNGKIDLSMLPPQPKEWYWDFITILPSGFGAAVGHECKGPESSLASIFLTKDGGRQWFKPDPKPRLPLLLKPSWPVERFASIALPTRGVIALAWDDPWDNFQSHVICSRDEGHSWKYHNLGYTLARLAVDAHGSLLTLNDGYYMKSDEEVDSWKKCEFLLDWPEGYHENRIALLRHVTFTGSKVGYALVVHWHMDSIRDSPPNVGLVTTTDSGVRWKHLRVFEGQT